MNELTRIFNQLAPANQEKVLTLARALLAEQEANPVPRPQLDPAANKVAVKLLEQPPGEPIRVSVRLGDAPQAGEGQ